MALITVDVEIQGTNSLLQHRFTEAAQAASGKATRKVKLQHETPRVQATQAAYIDDKGFLYHPGAAISRALREAGASHKQRGSRKSLKWIVPAGIIVMDDRLAIYKGSRRVKKFEVDSRPVVIPATKGRIMRHRPRLDEWSMRFRLRVNDTVIDVDTAGMLLVQAGEQIGIGDFRPERGGPFGTFLVTKWDSHEKQKVAAK